MSDFDRIKKQLSSSTTLPVGSTGNASNHVMMGSLAAYTHDEEDECLEDSTNPSGGCGCC